MMRTTKPRPGGRTPAARPHGPEGTPGGASAGAPPALARDPWALAVALALVPALIASRGAALGEPFADDFDFLRHALLEGPPSWLDGGGGALYWRPLARQAYYAALGPMALAAPWAVAALHALALACAGVLLYRALRPAWPAWAAAAAGSFALLLESVRMLIAWPSGAQDLGVVVFGAAALHALSRGRRAWAMGWMLAALLCKETAIALAVTLPLWPAHAARGRAGIASRADRARTAGATLALLAAWGAAHQWVAHAARQITLAQVAPEPSHAGALARAAWSVLRALRDAIDVDLLPALPRAAIAAGAALIVAGALVAGRGRGARPRDAGAWLAWSVPAWLLAVLPLGAFHPAWANYRSVVPSLVLGVAVTAAMRAAGPAWIAALAALRLGALAANPGAPPRLDAEWADRGSAFDFPRLATVQRFVRETRATLRAAHPTLPHGARIAPHAWPRRTLYAFEGAKAFQVWYRDTTIGMVSSDAVEADPDLRVDAVLEFQPERTPQVTLVSPAAMRALVLAVDTLRAGRYAAGLAALDAAERLQPDTTSAVFLATVWSKRAMGLAATGRSGDAERAARRAMALYSRDRDARLTLAGLAESRGDTAAARAWLDDQLRWYPDDRDAQAERARLGGGR